MVSRVLYTLLGFVCVGIGGIGVFVPGLPTTVFFIVAAWAFAKSNPKLEAWVLGLPGVGAAVRDYRDGLGMPMRAKVLATAMLVTAVGISVVFGVKNNLIRAAIVSAGAVGVYWIHVRVPTREDVVQ